MLIAPLPFDYVALLDSGDRIRRTRRQATGTRVRRPGSGSTNA